jgi:hypothetical protein
MLSQIQEFKKRAEPLFHGHPLAGHCSMVTRWPATVPRCVVTANRGHCVRSGRSTPTTHPPQLRKTIVNQLRPGKIWDKLCMNPLNKNYIIMYSHLHFHNIILYKIHRMKNKNKCISAFPCMVKIMALDMHISHGILEVFPK